MSPTFDLDSAQIIVLTTAGLILLVNAISSLISALTVYAVLSDLPTSSAWHEIISQLVNSAIQIILGLWLVFGGKGLVNIIKKIRTAGVK